MSPAKPLRGGRPVKCVWRERPSKPRCGKPSTAFGMCDEHRKVTADALAKAAARSAMEKLS